jgi:import inner membrane translocase subunit TIM9
MFHNMFETCFTSCVDEFTSKALSSRENGCISRCVQKTLAMQQRLGERFQEHSQTTMMNQQQ